MKKTDLQKYEKKEIKLGDLIVKFSDLGLDFYVKGKKERTLWLNTKGTIELFNFLKNNME